MRADRVEHLIDSDRPDLLGLLGLLDENLLMQVVAIVSHEYVRLLEQQHDIDTLIELLAWQVRWHHRDS